MDIKEFQGQDILATKPEFAIAHAVSADLVMGGGLALQIVHKYPRMKPMLQEAVRQGWLNAQVSEVLRWSDPESERVIYNCITKALVYQNAGKDRLPNTSTVLTCLRKVRTMMVLHGEDKLVLPQIGCGLDRMNWEEVRPLIYDVFGTVSVPGRVGICSL